MPVSAARSGTGRRPPFGRGLAGGSTVAMIIAVVVGIPVYLLLVLVMVVVSFGVMYAMWRDICGEAPAAEAPRDDRIEL